MLRGTTHIKGKASHFWVIEEQRASSPTFLCWTLEFTREKVQPAGRRQGNPEGVVPPRRLARPQHAHPVHRAPLTLKASSCPSGARCSSRTSSMALSQNMAQSPQARGLVNCPLSSQAVGQLPAATLRSYSSWGHRSGSPPAPPQICAFGAKHAQPIGAR